MQRWWIFVGFAEAGLSLLVAGLVIGYELPVLTLAATLALTAGTAVVYLYYRWLLARLRRSI
jgi:hypothetical protein